MESEPTHRVRDVVLSIGRLLARPHILSPVSEHFQKKDMGDDLFTRKFLAESDMEAWQQHRAKVKVSSEHLAEIVINDVEVHGGEVPGTTD